MDVGCGSGIPIDEFLLDRGFSVTGMDISEEQINLAKKNLPKGKFSVVEMSDISFPESSLDSIISFYAIFHIPREEHFSLFKKFIDRHQTYCR